MRSIDNYFSELDTIAIFCSVNTGINDHEIFELLQQKNLGNTYSQIGVAGLDGFIYTGSGSKQNVSGQDYFQRAIKGERVVSNVITDANTGRDIIVLAIPIERNGVITGAACSQYDVQSFTDLLSSSQFKGAGATMIDRDCQENVCIKIPIMLRLPVMLPMAQPTLVKITTRSILVTLLCQRPFSEPRSIDQQLWHGPVSLHDLSAHRQSCGADDFSRGQ